MSFLLDTNVVSEIRRARDRNVGAWVESVDADLLFLSVMTLGEIRTGIDRLRVHDESQSNVFASWLAELHTRFANRILSVDHRVADEWGRLNAAASRNTVDSLIAATALVHDLTVVTRNTRHFEGCDVALLNPWEYSPPE